MTVLPASAARRGGIRISIRCARWISKCLEFIKTFMIPAVSPDDVLTLKTPHDEELRICANIINRCYFRRDTRQEHSTTNGSRLQNFVIKRGARIGG